MLTTLTKDELVWLSTADGYSIPGKIVGIDPIMVQCTDTNEIIQLENALRLTKRKEFNTDVENLSDVSDESESALLLCLKRRFENKRIYTFAGKTLLVVNPFKKLQIYDRSVANLYVDSALLATTTTTAKTAHVFAVGKIALKRIREANSLAETICFCGESGSGKSSNVLQLAKYIVSTSGAESSPITVDKVEALINVINAFCGAKTRKSDCATRVGYCLDFFYKNGLLCGMVPKFVLPLELTRLVWQQNGERNFDVFYQMCSGIQQELRHKFGLNKSQKYFYLNLRKRNSNSDTDEEKFGILLKSFKTLEMSEDQQTFIFRILSAILHFGNLFFTNRQTSSNASNAETSSKVRIANERELKWVAYLLKVDIAELKSILTEKKIVEENSATTTVVQLTIEQALNMRDSIAQIVYNSLVRWIISLLANDYGCSNYNGVISLVDYYGFERYNNNGYEQLCVNIVNEYIENFFYKKVFKEVEKEYEDELITIDYQVPSWIDNKRVVDLLLKRPDGLISLLNDECKFPKASNEGYLKKCDLNHSENSVYGKSRSKDRLEFGVKHFCGFNYYNANGFVQKNCQHISAEAIKMLANSQNASLAQIFKNFIVNGKSLTTNDTFIYVAQSFNQEIKALIEKLNRTNCQFVRCIRSNTERQPEKFCDQTIIRQIRAYALLDTAKITRRGYTTKSKIIAFAERYSCILPKEANDHESINEKVHDILEQQGFRYQNHYAIGKHLEQLRNNIRGKSAITIQKSVRGMLARNRYEKQRHAAVVIQSGFRAWKARKEVKNMRDELIKKIGLETKKLNHISNIDDDDSSTYTDTDAVVQYLDLPEDLQKQIKISRNPKSYKTRTVVRYNPMSSRCQIPKIPNLISIEEFAETCFKGHLLGARREPIATPFLPKDFDNDFKESLLIFRLILRYMNDTQLSDEKLAVLAKYILQKGIDMPEQRDEIYVQLCNQTYNNRAVTSTTRAWTLLLAACNCFAPSIHVFPMLMSYFQTIPEHLSNMLISGLLRRIRSANSATQRLLPSTFIELAGFKQQQPCALRIHYPNNEETNVEADGWMTASEMARACLRLKGIGEPEGWTISLSDEDWLIDGAGNQFLYDLIAQRELLENCTKAELPTEICKACFAIFNNQTLANGSLLTNPFSSTFNQFSSPSTLLPEYMQKPSVLNEFSANESLNQRYCNPSYKNRRSAPIDNQQFMYSLSYRNSDVDNANSNAFGGEMDAFVEKSANNRQEDRSRQSEYDYGIFSPQPAYDKDMISEQEMQQRYRQKQQEFSEISRQELKPQYAYIPQQNTVPLVSGQVHFIPVMLPTTSFVPPQINENIRQTQSSRQSNSYLTSYRSESNENAYSGEQYDQPRKNQNLYIANIQRNNINNAYDSGNEPINKSTQWKTERMFNEDREYCSSRPQNTENLRSKDTNCSHSSTPINVRCEEKRCSECQYRNKRSHLTDEQLNSDYHSYDKTSNFSVKKAASQHDRPCGRVLKNNDCESCTKSGLNLQEQVTENSGSELSNSASQTMREHQCCSCEINKNLQESQNYRSDNNQHRQYSNTATSKQNPCLIDNYTSMEESYAKPEQSFYANKTRFPVTQTSESVRPVRSEEKGVKNSKADKQDQRYTCPCKNYSANTEAKECNDANADKPSKFNVQHTCDRGTTTGRLHSKNSNYNSYPVNTGDVDNPKITVVYMGSQSDATTVSTTKTKISTIPEPNVMKNVNEMRRFTDDNDNDVNFFTENWSYSERRPLNDDDGANSYYIQRLSEHRSYRNDEGNLKRSGTVEPKAKEQKNQRQINAKSSVILNDVNPSSDSQTYLEQRQPQPQNSQYIYRFSSSSEHNNSQESTSEFYNAPSNIQQLERNFGLIHYDGKQNDQNYSNKLSEAENYDQRVYFGQRPESSSNFETFSKNVNYPEDEKQPVSKNRQVASTPIRRMKIPAKNSDVDEFLDAVFEQALPKHELDKTNRTKMDTALIIESIKGGANGPTPIPNGNNQIMDFRYSKTGSSPMPPQMQTPIPQTEYSTYTAQPMMFMMPVDGRTLQPQPMMSDAAFDGRCLSPVIPVMFPQMVPSNMMVCVQPKTSSTNCVSPTMLNKQV